MQILWKSDENRTVPHRRFRVLQHLFMAFEATIRLNLLIKLLSREGERSTWNDVHHRQLLQLVKGAWYSVEVFLQCCKTWSQLCVCSHFIRLRVCCKRRFRKSEKMFLIRFERRPQTLQRLVGSWKYSVETGELCRGWTELWLRHWYQQQECTFMDL